MADKMKRRIGWLGVGLVLGVLLTLGVFRFYPIAGLAVLERGHPVTFFDERQSGAVHRRWSAKLQVIALALSDPMADARDAFQRGDQRFAAVLGVNLVVPHAPEGDHREKVKTIVGTNDFVTSSLGGTLNRLAYSYAGAYNDEIGVLLTPGGRTAPASKSLWEEKR